MTYQKDGKKKSKRLFHSEVVPMMKILDWLLAGRLELLAILIVGGGDDEI